MARKTGADERPSRSLKDLLVAMRGMQIAFTLAATGFTLWALSELLPLVHTPDLSMLQALGATLLNPGVTFQPEPMEQLRFAVLFPAAFALLFVFWCASRQLLPAPVRAPVGSLSFIGLPSWITGLLLLCVLGGVAYGGDFVYQRSIVGIGNPKVFFLFVFPLFLVAYHGLKRALWNRLLTGLWPLFLLILVVICVSSSLFTDATPPRAYHFNPVVYPLALIRSGMAIGGEVLSLYGFYPTYLAPVLGLFAPSIVSVCMAFAFLIVVAYLSLGYAARCVLGHPALVACVACATPWMGWYGPRAAFAADSPALLEDPYFQYLPVRVLFPALVLATLGGAVRGRGRERRRLAGAMFFAVTGMLFNLDSGLACVLSVLAYGLARWPFRWVRDPGSLLPDLVAMTREVFLPLGGGAGLAILLFEALFWLQTGVLPAPSRYFEAISELARVGFSFLPMPAGVAFWHFHALCLALCALLGFPLLWEGGRVRLGSFHVAVSVMGMALLVYYVGRSHPHTLFGPSWIAPLALGLIVQRTEGLPRVSFGRWAGLLGLAYLSAATFSLALNLASHVRLGQSRLQNVRKEHSESSPLRLNAEFMHNHSRGRKDVMLFAIDNEGPLYLLSGLRPILPMSSSTDLLLRQETRRIVDFLRRNTDIPVFSLGNPPSRVAEIVAVLNELYVNAESGGAGMSLLVRKATPP